MLFGDQLEGIPWWVVLLVGGAGGGVVGKGADWVWKLVTGVSDRRKADAKELKDEADRDEETALARLRVVMELREADCNRQIALLTRRVDDLERVRDARQVERDDMIEKLAILTADNKYLRNVARRAGIELDDRDKPDSAETLPAVNLPPKGGTP